VEVVKSALRVCQREAAKNPDEDIDRPDGYSNEAVATDDEWAQISQVDLSPYWDINWALQDPHALHWLFEWHPQHQGDHHGHGSTLTTTNGVSALSPPDSKVPLAEVAERDEELQIAKEACVVLRALESSHACQKYLNGVSNTWIVKPASKSRGRGVELYRHLNAIADFATRKEGSLWITQKYIERPLIIKRKKFDIRQWVVVTDWNPLTVWFYRDAYVRFSVEDFDLFSIENRFKHLTNYSISKNSAQFYSTEIEGNMWSSDEFKSYLLDAFGRDVWGESVQPAIRRIVRASLQCVQQAIENRRNSHEIFGYDFMVDEGFNVWLLEVNSCPDLDYTTPTTEYLVRKCLHDLIKVVVDWADAPPHQRREIDTGGFELLHQGQRIDRSSTYIAAPHLMIGRPGRQQTDANDHTESSLWDESAPTSAATLPTTTAAIRPLPPASALTITATATTGTPVPCPEGEGGQPTLAPAAVVSSPAPSLPLARSALVSQLPNQ